VKGNQTTQSTAEDIFSGLRGELPLTEAEQIVDQEWVNEDLEFLVSIDHSSHIWA
jgi:hypothetical protein